MNNIPLYLYYVLVVASVVALTLMGASFGAIAIVAVTGVFLAIMLTGLYLRTLESNKLK